MIYVSSACLKKEKIDEVLKEYVDAGIINIELSGGTTYYANLIPDLIKFKQEHKVEYACHAYFPPPERDFVVNLAACNDLIYEQSIEHYKKCIELLPQIGCNVLSVHAGFLTEISTNEIGKKLTYKIIYDRDEAIEKFCNAIIYLKKLCKEKGISLYVENNVLSEDNYCTSKGHNYLLMTDYASICEIRKKVEFDLLLDLGHLYVSANTLKLNFEEQVRQLGEVAKWIHVSENNGIRDEHKPLVEGSNICKELQQIDKKINITLETKGNIHQILNSVYLVENIIKHER